jgi:hypothetical protein
MELELNELFLPLLGGFLFYYSFHGTQYVATHRPRGMSAVIVSRRASKRRASSSSGPFSRCASTSSFPRAVAASRHFRSQWASGLEDLIYSANRRSRFVMLTLANRKVYVGLINWVAPHPEAKDAYIAESGLSTDGGPADAPNNGA